MRKSCKVMIVFGTRPEAIKLAPVILGLRAHPRMACHVCVTAQHRQMLDQVLQVFGIAPDSDLDLMRSDQRLSEFTARAIRALGAMFRVEQPDLALVQGDTTTVFCAALAAFYHHIPVGHVEAGLRTGDLGAPWPEEGNRVLTSRLASLHFAPTEQARLNLLREGILAERIHVTGNTVIDALHQMVRALDPLPATVSEELGAAAGLPAGSRMVLITGHRRESFGDGFDRICRAIQTLAGTFPDVQFVYPVHLNPRVREPVERSLRTAGCGNVHLIAPVSYPSFVHLMNRAYLILTDSGGVQEEAPSLGKPVFIMRETTERPEAVAAGACRLVGTNADTIFNEVSGALDDPAEYRQMAQPRNLFGDGSAATRIRRACLDFLTARRQVS